MPSGELLPPARWRVGMLWPTSRHPAYFPAPLRHVAKHFKIAKSVMAVTAAGVAECHIRLISQTREKTS